MKNIEANKDRSLYNALALAGMSILWHFDPFTDIMIPIAGIIAGILSIKKTSCKWAYVSTIVSLLVLIYNIIVIILILN